ICNGINTLISLLALTAVYAYLLVGPPYKKAIIFAFAFPMAILANVARIAAVILIANYHGDEVAMTFHNFSSPLFFIIAFLCVVLLAWILRCKLSLATLRK
ncbi:MAG: exosortase/archaeosortase family protein, partial [Dehalococcoidia bacterium]